MQLSATHFQRKVLSPTLEYLNESHPMLNSLLLGTAAIASNFHLIGEEQYEGLGVFQITSTTHRHIWDDYLAFKPDLASRVRGLASQRAFLTNPDAELETNLTYSVAIAWSVYKARMKQNSYGSTAEDCLALWHRFWPDKTSALSPKATVFGKEAASSIAA